MTRYLVPLAYAATIAALVHMILGLLAAAIGGELAGRL